MYFETCLCHSKDDSLDQGLLYQIAGSVVEYIHTGKARSFGGRSVESLVEHGFARFYELEEGIADEPLALLAATDYFSIHTAWSLQCILSHSLTSSNTSKHGYAFERFGAYICLHVGNCFSVMEEPFLRIHIHW